MSTLLNGVSKFFTIIDHTLCGTKRYIGVTACLLIPSPTVSIGGGATDKNLASGPDAQIVYMGVVSRAFLPLLAQGNR